MLRKYFNKAAASYDLNAELQKKTGDKLLSYILKNNFQSENILDIGCGTGIVTEKFSTQLSYQSFHALDIADSSLIIAKNRLKHRNIQFYLENFNTFESTLRYDLIYSNMSLHWSENILLTIRKLLSQLHKNGKLIFSIPLIGTFTELEGYFGVREFITQNVILDNFEVILHEEEKIILEFPSMLHALQSLFKKIIVESFT